jgi:hypothetical protein
MLSLIYLLVYCDKGALTSLDVGGNSIGGYYSIPGNKLSFKSTPAGIHSDTGI